MSRSAAPLGAYGLALRGVEAVGSLLVPARPDWPRVELVLCEQTARPEREWVSEETAGLATRSGAWIEIDRRAGRVVFFSPRPLSAQALVHPHLAAAAAVISRWHGRESFHAGAFLAGGGAWALFGERGSGKSSTLAALALRGFDVVSDDMLILGGARPFAGPRCIDLREDVAGALGVGEPIGLAGERERWRLLVPGEPASAPLRGFVFLDWADEVETVEVPASRRLAGLLHYRGLRLPAVDPELLLELSALPAWELRRPQGVGSLDRAVDRLIQVTGG